MSSLGTKRSWQCSRRMSVVRSEAEDMACSLSLAPPCQLRLLAGQEHGRTIPLAEITPRKVGQIQPLAARNIENTSPTPQKITSVFSVSKSFRLSERARSMAIKLTGTCG